MNDARTPHDASLIAVLTFIDKNDWWYRLPPVVRAYFRLKARIMGNRYYPLIAMLVIAAIAGLSYLLRLQIDVVLVILLAGIFLGLLIAWAMNHSGNHK